MFIVKTKQPIKLQLFTPVNIKLLVPISAIYDIYVDTDEDIDAGSKCELLLSPSGAYLEHGGHVYIDTDNENNGGNDVVMIEDKHFKFI